MKMRGMQRLRVWTARLLAILIWSGVLIVSALLVRSDLFVRERAITVLAWAGSIDRTTLKRFEAETGIRVFFNTYATNEELLVKLRATGGAGYDLVFPSDYGVRKLIDEGLIKKIDKQRCLFWRDLNPLLMGLYYDPTNDYSIPFGWDLYCIGIDRRRVDPAHVKNGWDLIFPAPETRARLVMSNDPLEALLFAYVACGHRDATRADIEALRQMDEGRRAGLSAGLLRILRSQRRHVEAYASVRADYFLGMGYVDAAIMQTTDLFRAMKGFKDIDFVVPFPAFVTVENSAIPAASTKDDMVYAFLNFLYRPTTIIEQFAFCPTPPVRSDVLDSLKLSPRYRALMSPSPEDFQKYLFIADVFPEAMRYDLWVAVKS
ncbi:MAG: extracellular solute-binding protein [Candidatus Dependentiae bacterium]|nr:extracellular solute-binding protein [Candidatus Dependentiae bacterium]